VLLCQEGNPNLWTRNVHRPGAGGVAVELIPAIDLLGGRVVRLAQGRYDAVTAYGDDPVAVAQRWIDEGATRLHLVDLDGARAGEPAQSELVGRIVRAATVPCQVAGGIRTAEAVRLALDAGADRVVLGSALIRDEGFGRSLVAQHGASRIVAAIDVRDGRALGDGWIGGRTDAPVVTLVDRLAGEGIDLFAVTAIARDGMQAGPDFALLRQVAAATGGPGQVIASGGITTLEDIAALQREGYAAAILGRSLYEGTITLRSADSA
jgi:phosphoribosylformimino-5-aminoimidazole carboxamide ribotide isomerase